MSLEFECAQYALPAETGVIDLRVVLDGDTAIPGAQPVPNGLFSFGFIVHFDAALVELVPPSAVQIQPALDYSGFSSGALITTGKGFLTVKGNIFPIATPYFGTQLAVVRLRVIGPPIASTPVTLEIFEQSASDAVFVDGAGTEIDPVITPRPSAVAVLDPLRIEWVPSRGAVGPHARLTYGVHAGFNFQVQGSETLGSGSWQTLPGAPHNSGELLDFAITNHRFYRLALFKR